VLEQRFDLTSVPDDVRDRYNLAPSDPIPVIHHPRVVLVTEPPQDGRLRAS